MPPAPPRLVLRPGRERSALQRHPWLFSGAVARLEGRVAPGALAAVESADGARLGWAWVNPDSDIRARLWTFGPADPPPAAEELTRRLTRAVAFRRSALDLEQTTAWRAVNGEGDALGGLIVDHYDGWIVLQPLAKWVERHWGEVLAGLRAAFGAASLPLRGALVRVEEDAARHEGLTLAGGVPEGFDAPPAELEAREHGLTMRVDVYGGQKTGHFIDQRDNRRRVGALARGGRLLNLFAYTGGFTLHALAQGARETLNVDASAPALETLRANLTRNGFPNQPAEQTDVKQLLPELQRRGERFDVVVCDPPPLARRREHVERAARLYKDLNRRAMSLIDDGWLATFSCSPFVDGRLLRQILFQAAAEAGVFARLVAPLGAGVDHPTDLHCPEGEYLHGYLLRVQG